jgi:hypothetical protein
MNNQEVTMHDPQPGLIAHRTALEAADIAISLALKAPARCLAPTLFAANNVVCLRIL